MSTHLTFRGVPIMSFLTLEAAKLFSFLPIILQPLPEPDSSRQPTPPPVCIPITTQNPFQSPPSTRHATRPGIDLQHRALGSAVTAHRAAAEEAAATRSWRDGDCDCVIVAMGRWHMRQHACRRVCARRFLYMHQSTGD